MRVTYNRELKIKSGLDELGIENYLPMKYEIVEDGDNSENRNSKIEIQNSKFRIHERLVPAIHNLLFIRSTQETITALKMTNQNFAPLRYMMRHTSNSETEILTVPDIEMDNFIRVASVRDSSVFVVDDSDYFSKIGKMVRITAGQFQDVVGVVKRIKKNRCVVVRIQGVAAAVIVNIPSRFLEEVDSWQYADAITASALYQLQTKN